MELLVLGQSSWQETEPLPVKTRGIGAAVIDNIPFFFGNEMFLFYLIFYNIVWNASNIMFFKSIFYNIGGSRPKRQDFILKFNSTTSTLEQVGTMIRARSHFGISTLTNDVVENLIQYCL